MQISRSTYYEKPLSESRQIKKDLELKDTIAIVHQKFPGYGYRRLRQHFLRLGLRVNEKRIKRVMKKYSLFVSSKPTVRSRYTPTMKQMKFTNLIHGMSVTGTNQLWATDFTYVRLLREFICVNAIIDVYARKIVGWSISRDITNEFVWLR